MVWMFGKALSNERKVDMYFGDAERLVNDENLRLIPYCCGHLRRSGKDDKVAKVRNSSSKFE
jgi:hypothetical protein